MSLVVAGVVVAACSKVPVADMDAAAAATEAAVTAGAEEYATASYASVQDLKAQLDAELELQGGKFFLTRSYDHARELAVQMKTGAEAAAAEAVEAKEAVRQETTVLLDEVKVALEEVQVMLASAPTGKGSAADLAALRADLDSAKAMLVEGEAAFGEGRYMEAKTKITAVKSGAQAVRSAIEMAAQARTVRRGA